MKINTKQLLINYEKAKKKDKNNIIPSEQNYLEDCQELLNIIDKNKSKLYVAMRVSASGMTRHFAFNNYYNMVLNINYNQLASYDSVKVGGCGMDMLWHLLYRFCETATGYKIANKHLNSDCSHCTYVLSFNN